MIGLAILAQTGTALVEAAPTLMDKIDAYALILVAVIAAYQKFRASKATGLLDTVILGVEAYKSTLPQKDAKRLSGTISSLAVSEGAEPDLHRVVKRATEGARKAFVDDPPAPPRLGALLLAAALLLGAASGCVSQAARDLAVAHEAHLIAFDGASQPHDSYKVDDAEPGPDGKKLTAAEKLKAWRDARAEVLASARALAEALR